MFTMAGDVSLFCSMFFLYPLFFMYPQLTLASKAHVLSIVTGPVFLEGNLYFEVLEPEDIRYTFKIRPAKNFGVVMNTTFHSVELVAVDPVDGCSQYTNSMELYGTVALIERGGCSFLSKTIQAEKSGAIAAIIMDNDFQNDQRMIDMISDETDRTTDIPAFFLLGKDGYMIKRTLQTQHLNYASINIPINVSSIHDRRLHRPPWSYW